MTAIQTGSPDQQRPPGHVLVVEDDQDLRRIVVRYLSRWGFRTTEAADGGAGVDQFREAAEAIDVILLDIMLPVLDGVGVARVVRKERSDLPIVAYSAAFNEELVESLRALGVAHFLAKPFRAEDLRSVLDRALETPA